MENIKLTLKKESWENLFYNINLSPPSNPIGNFWGVIRCLEDQYDLCTSQNNSDSEKCYSKGQTELFKLTNKKE